MTVTVSNPPHGSLIGPGTRIDVSTSTLGPYPIDDFWQVVVVNAATGQDLVKGTFVNTSSSPNGFVVLGVNRAHFSPMDHLFAGLAAGSTVNIAAQYRHANGTIVDGAGFFDGPYSWDPMSGLWLLLNGAASSSLLQSIYDAVYRVFPG